MVPVALVVVVLVIVFPVASTFIAVFIQRLPPAPTPISTNTLITTHPPVVNPLLYFITFHISSTLPPVGERILPTMVYFLAVPVWMGSTTTESQQLTLKPQ
jgi:hypothetical protein